jgi:hypothetical protein
MSEHAVSKIFEKLHLIEEKDLPMHKTNSLDVQLATILTMPVYKTKDWGTTKQFDPLTHLHISGGWMDFIVELQEMNEEDRLAFAGAFIIRELEHRQELKNKK